MTHYDVIVIGAGSGANVIGDGLGGRSVAFVERGPFGGTCLNRGCIPSKLYVHPAELADAAARGPALGVRSGAEGVDWPVVRRRVLARIDAQAAAGERSYRDKPDVDVLVGTARFTGPRRLSVALDGGGEAEISGDQVVLATGGRPVVPDIPGLGDLPCHTSDDVMRLERLPDRVGVLGGGYVGAELAHVFAAYGAQVTQIDAADTLLGNQDEDVAARFTRACAQRWDVRLRASVERVEPLEHGGRLHLSDGTTADVDAVLVAIGRTPNSDTLDLSRAGVEVDEHGVIVVDEHLRTTAAGVWALGDASSDVPLKHAANQDARVVRHNLWQVLTGGDDLRVSDHRFVPSAVFSVPQVASVGLTAAQAREQGLDVAVARAEYADVARGWAMQADPDDRSPDADGLVKLLADRATGRLVGAHLLGDQASVLIQPLVLAISHGLPVRGLARSMYWIHPALTEVVEQALLALEADL